MDVKTWTSARPERWSAFYVRVTQEESVKTDLSIPNQIARAREIAAARGWSDYQIYVEPRHVSGELWIDKRPALKRLVDDIAAGRVMRVCARHIDRLWRNTTIQSRLLPVFHEHDIELWDHAHQLDYRSAHGRFSLEVLGAASQLEVRLTAERIREMKRGKARGGKPAGGPPPYGYTSQSRRTLELAAAGFLREEAYRKACLEYPIGKCWYVDDREAEIVRLIFRLYTSPKFRYGTKRIARYLNQHGYRTRHGHAWLSNYVNRVINNPAYAGYTTYDEISYGRRLPSRLPRYRQNLFAGEHPALITPEQWRQTQAIKSIENRIKRSRDGTEERRLFSLVGILRCPACSSRMVGKWTRHSKRSYYICSRRHLSGPELCSFPLLDAHQLHDNVWRWVHDVITSPPYVLEHLQRLAKQLESKPPAAGERMASLSHRREEIHSALNKYYEVFEASRDPIRDSALLERVKDLKSKLKELDDELTELKRQVVPRPKLDEKRVRAYLRRLRDRVEEHAEYQKVLFQELQREHGLKVRAISNHEFVVSMTLPLRDLTTQETADAIAHSRIATVVANVACGHKSPDSPAPGGPTSRRL